MNGVKNLFRELSDTLSLFDERNKALRRLVFYSEKDIYYQYYRELIEALPAPSGPEVCYITSDPKDNVFARRDSRVKPFYSSACLAYTFKNLRDGVLVMTMTDLGAMHIPRADDSVEHIYVFHAMVSTHLQYRQGAFDHYDTIFCVGPHHVEEIRRAEAVYGLKAKKLVEYGYPRVEKIYRDHQVFKRDAVAGSGRRRALIAPSWGEDNILGLCINDLIAALVKADYEVCIRPHPESFKRQKERLRSIAETIKKIPQVSLELDMLTDASLHKADVLITDRSGIAFEYFFGTERPVLFIDTPLKKRNPEYEKIGVAPVEISTRADMGIALRPDEMYKVPEALDRLRKNEGQFREKIPGLRDATVFNWMNSSRVGAEYISRVCHEKESR